MIKFPRLIIIDGPDGAGKTTLVKHLEEIVRRQVTDELSIVHHGPYKGEPKIASQYFVPMARALVRENAVVIFDRSWLSEPIYADATKRGPSRISAAERRMLERAALGLDYQVIIALPSDVGTCLRNRPDDDPWILRRAYDGFRKLLISDVSNTTLRYTYDIGDDATDMFTNTRDAPWRAPNYAPGIGRAGAGTVLIVGDKPNSAKHGQLKHRAPFMSFGTRSGCSAWLADLLENAGIDERRLYWINAFDSDDVPTDPTELMKINFRAVMLLGANAYKWFEKIGFPVAQRAHTQVFRLPHPQHQKRFHANEPYELIARLKEVV